MLKKLNEEGFTLLEILLVVAAIGILAGIVILALNPSKNLSETRDAQRQTDVNTILNAVWQYYIDNEALPTNIPESADCGGTATNEICRTDTAADCTGLVDISELTTSELYLTDIPNDPKDVSTNGTGYHIAKSTNDRVTVCAPGAEEAASIEVTR